MAGNRSVAWTEGRLSLARERRRVRFGSKTPIIVQTSDLYLLLFPKGEARKQRAESGAGPASGTISCGRLTRNPFKLCDFPLVTQMRVLY